MAAVCDICGKGPGFGKSVSHSHRRTSRRWDPNIQTVRAVTVPAATRSASTCARHASRPARSRAANRRSILVRRSPTTRRDSAVTGRRDGHPARISSLHRDPLPAPLALRQRRELGQAPVDRVGAHLLQQFVGAAERSRAEESPRRRQRRRMRRLDRHAVAADQHRLAASTRRGPTAPPPAAAPAPPAPGSRTR